ncbi:Uncharacterised protein [Mycobacteroides abscessus subsp. bolletii]|nr:Uncharacterised protein [Mycobacteroides abscessus subsp. bolletii]SKQ60594.1 Uncharacterised protein [Mycobacteroides abscessus subsp. bolletii]SKQ62176.1 Uncharacterised protein [Mycobacteroides abscessus subsp. bolletii]SKQ64949.1 Uncharacterised protein [Mycobacteroides abscessus subsp. bolletii]
MGHHRRSNLLLVLCWRRCRRLPAQALDPFEFEVLGELQKVALIVTCALIHDVREQDASSIYTHRLNIKHLWWHILRLGLDLRGHLKKEPPRRRTDRTVTQLFDQHRLFWRCGWIVFQIPKSSKSSAALGGIKRVSEIGCGLAFVRQELALTNGHFALPN